MTNSNGIKALLLKYREIITYGAVGIANTAADFAAFSVMRFAKPEISEAYAQAVGFAVGFTCSFLLNKYVTFKNNTGSIRQFVLFLLCNGVTLGVSMASIYFYHSVLGFQEHLAKLFLVTPVTMVLNYLGYKYFVFRKSGAPPVSEK